MQPNNPFAEMLRLAFGLERQGLLKQTQMRFEDAGDRLRRELKAKVAAALRSLRMVEAWRACDDEEEEDSSATVNSVSDSSRMTSTCDSVSMEKANTSSSA
ncbi:hypothetical protein BGW80DRAFT_1364150 [Lactifluus volemus]|nr:hypothetical protein BGW80DRAFT_1364150 [Lactifluus volemus]